MVSLFKIISICSIVFLVGCGNYEITDTLPLKTGNPRFEIVSITKMGMYGRIVVVKDTMIGQCMATYNDNGVMSWRVVCDEQEAQMMREMALQQLEGMVQR